MGLASGQLRFLMLTSRKNDLEYNAMKISNEKTSLARDMNKVTKDYQNSLNTRRFKLSNNNGSTFSDLSYKNLMKPSLFNNYKPYFISNQQGRIVLNSEYADIARSLDIPQSGGISFDSLIDKPATLTALSNLTGIEDKNKIEWTLKGNAPVYEKDEKGNYKTDEYGNKIYALDDNGNIKTVNVKDLQNTAFYYDGVFNYWNDKVCDFDYFSSRQFIDKLFDSEKVKYNGSTVDRDWLDEEVGSLMQYNANNDADKVKKIKAVFTAIIENNKSRFSNAEYNEIMARINGLGMDPNRDNKNDNKSLYYGNSSFGENENNSTGNVISTTTYRELLAIIIKDAYEGKNYRRPDGVTVEPKGSIQINNPTSSGYYTQLIDNDLFGFRNPDYEQNCAEASKAKAKSDEAYKAFQEALANKNSILNADEETSLEFYENILRAICEKGWSENSRVNDAEYLDNMLQNNTYMMTTQTFKEGLIEYQDFQDAGYIAASKNKITAGTDATDLIKAKREEIDKMYKNGDYTPDTYSYTTRIASDFSQLFNVTDTDLQAEAEAEYTYQRNIIKQKEARLDVQLEKIKTEQSAISQMMQSIKQQMSSNIERSMTIFSA